MTPRASAARARSWARRSRRVAGAARRRGRDVRRRVGDYPRRRRLHSIGVRSGRVEIFSRTEIIGRIEVTPGTPPVRVALFADDLEVAATWAVDATAASGGAEQREFRLALRDIWDFCPAGTRLSVRTATVPLPIAGHGLCLRVATSGRGNLDDLAERLSSGHVFGQFGGLQLSKSRDLAWQQAVLDLYERLRARVAAELGYETFFCYGTLLGAVRENGFIGHDLDFDAAYVSAHSSGADSARELKELALRLVDAGLNVDCKRTALHIYHDRVPDARIDLFHLYFDESGRLQFPFGIAGDTEVRRDHWKGVRDIDFVGRRGQIPANADELVEHIYGRNWRVPKPGFRWERDRTRQAPRDALMPRDFAIEVFWENFYARQDLDEPSGFARELAARPDLPDVVVELGCGAGQDATLFASCGRTVVAVERSRHGVTRARERAARAGLSERAAFHRYDLRTAEWTDVIPACGPRMFYARFLLHAVEQRTQDRLLAEVRRAARRGDHLALEVRTTDDATASQFGRHYRRRIDAAALLAALGRTGWTVFEQSAGTGLASFRGEDPHVLRVVARLDQP